MKKHIFGGPVSLAIIATAAIVTVSSVNTNSSESNLLSQNIEALTKFEDTDTIWDIYLWNSGAYDCQTGGEYACEVTR